MLLVLHLAPAGASVGSPEQDESRIETLVRIERHPEADAAPAPSPPVEARVATAPTSPSAAVTVSTPPAHAPPPPAKPAAIAAPVDTAFDEADETGLRLEDLKRHIGETLRITTSSGVQRNARVQSADARQVTLLVSQPGGTATYTLQRAQIVGIEMP
jgi:hypothetical protein